MKAVSDDDLCRMVSVDGFCEVFYEHTSQSETFADTFWRLNFAYRDKYGRQRYSDYTSFATVRGRRHGQ